jgi:hypothetical protein
MRILSRGKGLVRTFGVAGVNTLSGWIDAKPYRFKLLLLAHTAAVGAILLAAVRLF